MLKSKWKKDIIETEKGTFSVNCVREPLSELEHIQWAHWTKYFLENLTDENIKRWKKQMETPYGNLSEKEKDSDRKWADECLSKLKSIGLIHEVDE